MVQVFIGNAKYLCSCVRYVTPVNIILIICVTVCVVVLVIIVIVIVVVLCYRRRRRKKDNVNTASTNVSTANVVYNAALDFDDDYDDGDVNAAGYNRHLPADTEADS